MQYNKINLDKIAKFFEKKIKEEGRENYKYFIEEHNILEFSDLIECINNKNENNILVKRNAIYLFDDDNYYNYNYQGCCNSALASPFSSNNITLPTVSISSNNSTLPTVSNSLSPLSTGNCTVNNSSSITLGNVFTISTSDVYIDNNLYLLIPKDFAQKIFLLESL